MEPAIAPERRPCMKFYTGKHKFYCGVDLHARTMFLCVLVERGYPLLERNIKTEPEHESPDEFLGRADRRRSCRWATEPR
jgi:hypothetical protein